MRGGGEGMGEIVDCTYGVVIEWSNSNEQALELVTSSNLVNGGGNILDNNNSNRIASILRPLSLMPDASPFELQALEHFIQGTSPTLIALEIPHDNPKSVGAVFIFRPHDMLIYFFTIVTFTYH